MASSKLFGGKQAAPFKAGGKSRAKGTAGAHGKFIAQAIKKPGALRASLGAKKGQPIPVSKLAKAAKAKGKLGQRARFAAMLKKLNH